MYVKVADDMSLKIPNIRLAFPNESEELIVELYKLTAGQVESLIDKGFNADYKGRETIANLNYQGGNIFFYLMYYGLAIRSFIQRESQVTAEPIYNLIEAKYAISCVEKNLECLSSKHDVNYVKFWEEVTELLGIPRSISDFEKTCCVGVGEMIIEGPDCKVHIVGGCLSSIEKPTVSYGSFDPCAFRIQEVTQSFGDGIYDDCD